MWKWAPLHVLGSQQDFPKRSEAVVAMGEFMAKQNKIGFKIETAATVVDFVERVYLPAIAVMGLYFLQPSTRKSYTDIWGKHLKERVRRKRMRRSALRMLKR
jgi:hypothetical protein